MFNFKVGDLVTFRYKFRGQRKEVIGAVVGIQQDLNEELVSMYPGSISMSVLSNNGKIIDCFSGDLLKIINDK